MTDAARALIGRPPLAGFDSMLGVLDEEFLRTRPRVVRRLTLSQWPANVRWREADLQAPDGLPRVLNRPAAQLAQAWQLGGLYRWAPRIRRIIARRDRERIRAAIGTTHWDVALDDRFPIAPGQFIVSDAIGSLGSFDTLIRDGTRELERAGASLAAAMCKSVSPTWLCYVGLRIPADLALDLRDSAIAREVAVEVLDAWLSVLRVDVTNEPSTETSLP